MPENGTSEDEVVLRGDLMCGEPVEGRFFDVSNVEDVMECLEVDGEDLILYVGESSVSLVSPVLEFARGVACPGGGAGSHIEIVSRELGIACVCNVEVEGTLPERYSEVRVMEDGRIVRVSANNAAS